MAETRRRFDREFREGAVRIVRETGKPIAQVARDLGIHEVTLGNWVNQDRQVRGDADRGGLSEDERAEPNTPPRRRPARRGLTGLLSGYRTRPFDRDRIRPVPVSPLLAWGQGPVHHPTAVHVCERWTRAGRCRSPGPAGTRCQRCVDQARRSPS
jgi:transposase-like protein